MQPSQRRIVPTARRVLICGMLFSALLALVPGGAAAPRPAITPQVVQPPPFAISLNQVADVTPLGGEPVGIIHPNNSGRLFIILRAGKIAIYDGMRVLPAPFLDITALVNSASAEQGLLSVAFDPNYRDDGYFYVYYTSKTNGDIVIASYQVSSDPNVADPTSARVLLTIPRTESNNSGGQLQFGRRGELYISTGDGGGVGDPHGTIGNAQDLSTLLGKILRIYAWDSDPSDGLPYDIPPDNPFASDGDPNTRAEIWAYGLRDPRYFSFDSQTGDMFIGDVGETIEEINYQPAADGGGKNYGWRCREGNQPYASDSHCATESFTEPIRVYDHSQDRCAVTGGYRYRGSRSPPLAGLYFYADYCSGQIWAATQNGARWIEIPLLETTLSISAFGEDESGELYIADRSGGKIYQIIAPNSVVSLEQVADVTSLGGLPVAITHANDGSGRLFVTLQKGKIAIYDGTHVLPTPFLDITTLVDYDLAERGLLSVAFDPQYASNGYFYVDYTGKTCGDIVIARYQRSSADPNLADPASAQVLLTIPKQQSNHNGGQLQFGPDGYLYISTGDGGGGNDEGPGHNPAIGNAQDLNSLLGKILRIDVRNTNTSDGLLYDIPPGNPFASDGDITTRAEIWAYGLRNPWRFSFDRQTGDMFIGDVGEWAAEEINYQPAASTGGENYGWRCREGDLVVRPDPHCATEHFTDPIASYHGAGSDPHVCVVTGGYRYRGSRSPLLAGLYIHADYCSGKIWAVLQNGDRWTPIMLLDSDLNISTLGEDQEGELYVADLYRGKIYRIVVFSALPIGLEPVADLSPLGDWPKPVAITHANDGSGRLFITLEKGKVAIYDGTRVLPTPFLDISALVDYDLFEQGLLSVAFDPQYASNGYFYVDYTNKNGVGDIVIARYQRSSADPNLADPASAQVLLTIPKQQSNHNGGQLQFGPDGYLYISTGDGGGGNDEGPGHNPTIGNAQDLNSLLGKILRIDVRNNDTSDGLAYDIPPGNPFASDGDITTRAEIWAYGLRDPRHFNFDRQTGDMFISDVDEFSFYEIDYQPAASAGGENYGWRCRGANQPYRSDSHCATETFTEPIRVEDHSLDRCTVTGGYRYRGSRSSVLAGLYIYGGVCDGDIWALARDSDRWTRISLTNASTNISAVGEDQEGEVYVANGYGAKIYRIVALPTLSMVPKPVANLSPLGDWTQPVAITNANDEPGRLSIGDVGEFFFDEIDYQPAASTDGENCGGAIGLTFLPAVRR